MCWYNTVYQPDVRSADQMKTKNRLKAIVIAAGIIISAAFYILSGDYADSASGGKLLYEHKEAAGENREEDELREEELAALLEPVIRCAVREELTAICEEGYLEEALRQEASLAAAAYAAEQEEKRGKVDINTAGEDELVQLPGIGAKKAADIIEFRENNGGFSGIEDIMLVPGIGQSLYDRMSGSICT